MDLSIVDENSNIQAIKVKSTESIDNLKKLIGIKVISSN